MRLVDGTDEKKLDINTQVKLNRSRGIKEPAYSRGGRPILTSVWIPTKQQIQEYNKVPFHKAVTFTGRTFPFVVRKLILLYSNEGDLVYDPMLGSGTTLYEAVKLNRNANGSDVHKKQIESFKERWKKFAKKDGIKVKVPIVKVCNAENLSHLKDGQVDLLIMSFPWFSNWGFGNQQKSMEKNSSFKDFLKQSYRIYLECKRVVKSKGFICNILGSSFKNGKYYPVGMRIHNVIRKAGLKLHYQFWSLRSSASSIEDPWTRSAIDIGTNKADAQVGWDVHEDIIIARKK